MFYVYILESDKKYYVGYTTDLKRRLVEHNSGKNISTKFRSNGQLIFYEAFIDKADAERRETYFKTSAGRKALKLMLNRYRLAHSTSGKPKQ